MAEIIIVNLPNKVPPPKERFIFGTETWVNSIGNSKTTKWQLKTLPNVRKATIDQWIDENETYKQSRIALAAKICFNTKGVRHSMFVTYSRMKFAIISEKTGNNYVIQIV